MSENDKKWKQPNQPPPPLFVGQKERDLVKQVNDELIERVIGQTILYYPISNVYTDFHPLYGEAINKNFLPIQPGDVEKTYADVDTLKREFQYKPSTSVEHGIQKFIHTLRIGKSIRTSILISTQFSLSERSGT